MPKFLTFHSPSPRELKENPLKALWESFQSLDRFTKGFLIAMLLLFVATPFIVNNLQIFTPHAQETQSPARQLTNALLQAAKTYRLASADKKEEALAKLTEIATQRKAVMLQNVKSNPDEFLLNSLPNMVTKKWPKEVRDLVESQTNLDGEFTVIAVDNFDKGKSYTLYTLDKYTLHFAKGRPPSFLTGDKIKVSGFVLESDMVIDTSQSGTITNSVLAANVQSHATAHKVAVMLINFVDNTATSDVNGQPITVDNVSQTFFGFPDLSVDSYYRQNSYDKIYFPGPPTSRVFNWKTLNVTSTTCNPTDSRNWADLADKANNVNPKNYDHTIYIFPHVNACQFIGQGQNGGKRVWSNGWNFAGIFNHEIGHNLGLNHANAYTQCTTTTDLSTCTTLEREDLYDVMGATADVFSFHFNAPHKAQLNWLTSKNITTVTSKDNGKEYDIYPIEVISGSPTALKIPRGNSGLNYYIEYRQPIGSDNTPRTPDIAGGVILHVWSGNNVDQTNLLQLFELKQIFSQYDNFYVTADALTDGESFLDNTYGIRIEQLSHDSTKAHVKVTFGPGQCVEHPPQLNVSLPTNPYPASNSTYPGGSLTYSVSVHNENSETCPPNTFNLSQIVPDGWTGTFSQPTITLAPLGSTTVSLKVDSPSSATDGMYTITASAVDSANSSHTGSGVSSFIIDSSFTPTFTNLSATLCSDQATFHFTPDSSLSGPYTIDTGANTDSFTTGNGIYWGFGSGSGSPVVVSDVTKMPGYVQGATISWGVKASSANSGSCIIPNYRGTGCGTIQTATVGPPCSTSPTPSPTPPPSGSNSIKIMNGKLPSLNAFLGCAENSATHKIYCLGGDTNQIFEYDPSIDAVVIKSATQTIGSGIYNLNCAENSSTHKIYCLGGVYPYNHILEYDPSIDAVIIKSDSSYNMNGSACAENSSTHKIYCFAGGNSNRIQEYDSSTDQLTVKSATFPTGMQFTDSKCAENSSTHKIYCFGGFSWKLDYSQGWDSYQIFEYDPSVDQLTVKSPTSTALTRDIYCAQNSSTNKIYCFGPFSQIYEYDPSLDKYSPKSAQFPPYYTNRSCAENSATHKIYCFGGVNYFVYPAVKTDQIVEYTP